LQFLVFGKDGSPREYNLAGTTFSPYGAVYTADGEEVVAELKSDPMQRLSEISSLCNDSKIVYNAVSDFRVKLSA